MKIYYDIEIVTLLYQVSTEATQLGIYIYIYTHTHGTFLVVKKKVLTQKRLYPFSTWLPQAKRKLKDWFQKPWSLISIAAK